MGTHTGMSWLCFFKTWLIWFDWKGRKPCRVEWIFKWPWFVRELVFWLRQWLLGLYFPYSDFSKQEYIYYIFKNQEVYSARSSGHNFNNTNPISTDTIRYNVWLKIKRFLFQGGELLFCDVFYQTSTEDYFKLIRMSFHYMFYSIFISRGQCTCTL